jgi:hypothetical protein
MQIKDLNEIRAGYSISQLHHETDVSEIGRG